MKDKIIAALRSKYSSKYALSDKALAGIAAMLAGGITEEGQIDAAISAEGVVELLSGVQSYGDQRAADAKPKPADKPAEPNKPNDPPATPAPANETDSQKLLRETLEKVMSGMTELSNKVSAMETGKTVETRQQILEGKLKDAPEALKQTILDGFSFMQFKDDASFNEYIQKIEPTITAAIQGANDSKLNGIQNPLMPPSEKTGGNTFADVMKSLNTPATAAAATAAPAA